MCMLYTYNTLFYILTILEVYELLERPRKVLVISPLNAIIKDQLTRLEALKIPSVGLDLMCNVLNDKKEEI